LLTVSSPLNVEAEPRIKHSAEDEGTPKANPPFFWAGYMLVDCDTSPEQGGAGRSREKSRIAGRRKRATCSKKVRQKQKKHAEVSFETRWIVDIMPA
jgi:hypothetical protein